MALCVPDTDWSCVSDDELASIPDDTRARAEALAWTTLVRLTGGRLSLCPVAVRPCAARYVDQAGANTWGQFSRAWGPYIENGTWYNGCGCRTGASCACDSRRVIALPGGTSAPVTVTIDGATLDPSAYRVDNGYLLVRQDGDQWPLVQDLNAAPTDPGTFVVSYYQGVGPDDQLAYAAGLLAVEWVRACMGAADCRLPEAATQVVRQGVNFVVPAGVFDDGLSGIREVDAITGAYNPYRLKTPSRVLSPSRLRNRTRTS